MKSLDPRPETRNPKPETQNPKPETEWEGDAPSEPTR